MADTRQRTTWGNQFRFLTRAIGLTGLVAAAFGVMLLSAEYQGRFNELLSVEQLRRTAEGANGAFAKTAVLTFSVGAVVAVLVGVLELFGALVLGTGRRTVAGTTATIGAVAAVCLLVFVNLYAFSHYRRYDTTRDQRFTLPPALATELGKLRGNAPTTIVVLQMHNTFGSLSTKRDSFTSAAERQVTEKVLDLVEQFRELGPHFNVAVLDTEAFEYDRELAALTKDSPELKSAIEGAQQNSIFFHANKRVQRLSFNEFMQLDKTASRESDDARGNLVLVPQGIDRFAQRILAVQERRPKVAVCVGHEALSTARGDGWRATYTMAGLRKSLTDAGFDVTDIVLKKPGGRPAADTREESTLQRLEAELRGAEAARAAAARDAREFDGYAEVVQKFKDKPWAERKRAYDEHLGELFRGTLTEDQERRLLTIVERGLKLAKVRLDETDRQQKEIAKQVAEAQQDERALQKQRMTDVSAKLTSQLADVDLLVVPRFTSEDLMQGVVAPMGLHALNREQAKVAREFMKTGKPVLACLGPSTPHVVFDPDIDQSPQEFLRRWSAAPDRAMAEPPEEFERLLLDRGIELGRTAVVFDGETKALTADGFGSSPIEVPPVDLTEDRRAGLELQPNPVLSAIRQTGRTAERAIDLRLRAVRPVSLSRAAQARQPFAAEFMFTTADSWNTPRPFPLVMPGLMEYTPRFSPPSDDPKKGTRDEEKRGPFPIAVALEGKIPARWVNEHSDGQHVGAILSPLTAAPTLALERSVEQAARPVQRTVVFGSGNVFTGKELSPGQEKLLLHTVNWLTRREDRLPKAATEANPDWHYHRVVMSDRDRLLWRYGTLFGLPLVAAYAGVLVMMRRRMR